MTATVKGIIRAPGDAEAVAVEHARGATIEVLIGPGQGAPRFFTRKFSIEPGGRIPEHKHSSVEHEQVVLEGEMVVSLDGEVRVVKAGDAIFIPAGVAHWYENRSGAKMSFLCVVPKTDDYQTDWLEGPAAPQSGHK